LFLIRTNGLNRIILLRMSRIVFISNQNQQGQALLRMNYLNVIRIKLL
jgi:hypothetical protein